jgi:hypothetical protein
VTILKKIGTHNTSSLSTFDVVLFVEGGSFFANLHPNQQEKQYSFETLVGSLEAKQLLNDPLTMRYDGRLSWGFEKIMRIP